MEVQREGSLGTTLGSSRGPLGSLPDGTGAPSLFLAKLVEVFVPGGGLARVDAVLEKGGRVIVKRPPPKGDADPFEVQWEPLEKTPPVPNYVIEEADDLNETLWVGTLPAGRYRLRAFPFPDESHVPDSEIVVRAGETTRLDVTGPRAKRK